MQLNIRPHHIGALFRASEMLDFHAKELAKTGNYSAEIPSEDAKALRELATRQAELPATRQQEKAERLNQTLWDQLARKNRQIVRQGMEIQRLQELAVSALPGLLERIDGAINALTEDIEMTESIGGSIEYLPNFSVIGVLRDCKASFSSITKPTDSTALDATGGDMPAGSLLRKPNEPLQAGCYCSPGKCMAPVMMGRQMPCRDPLKAAGDQRADDGLSQWEREELAEMQAGAETPPAPRGKPSWTEAPEWAQWLAQDANGGWWWFEVRPISAHVSFVLTVDHRKLGRHKFAKWQDMNPDWRDTLEGRP